MIGEKIKLNNKINLVERKEKTKNFSLSPSRSKTNFDVLFVSSASTKSSRNPVEDAPKSKRVKKEKSGGGVYRALVTEKRKEENHRKSLAVVRTAYDCSRYSPKIGRKIIRLHTVLYPNVMTNSDLETQQNELVGQEEAREITYKLSCCKENDKEINSSDIRGKPSVNNVDVTSMAYLRSTYNHLHENQFLKLNELLSDSNNNSSAELKMKKKQKINLRKGLCNEKPMDLEEDIYTSEEGSFSSENSNAENNEIAEITDNMRNIQFDADLKSPSKPIITFTPVRSVEDELNERCSSPNFSDKPPSSGSSSPLLEVPVSDFGDLSTEMMRPPIN